MEWILLTGWIAGVDGGWSGGERGGVLKSGVKCLEYTKFHFPLPNELFKMLKKQQQQTNKQKQQQGIHTSL